MSPHRPYEVDTHPSPHHSGSERGGRPRHHHEDCPLIGESPSPSHKLEGEVLVAAAMLLPVESRMGLRL